MKFSTVVLLALIAGVSPATAGVVEKKPTPMARVVKLIDDLKSGVLSDGKKEQEAYDKYACWCEKTLQKKAAAISEAKDLITETEILIKKLKGEIASHQAEIAQLNKDIAQNKEAQKEAKSVRDKEYADYAEEKSESEQCIGALEAAITVLTGAGTKKGFLDVSKQAQLLSVAAEVRTIFGRGKMQKLAVSQQDIDMVRNFVSKPEDFLKHATGLTQVGNNPFGDYAPQSTQIQGILKGMYDAFTADLEKDNVAEADSQKSFEELMATKEKELATLEATLGKQEADEASKTKTLAEEVELKDTTAEQLAADEEFFSDTKAACQDKATEWSVRTRLRTEELAGMEEAIKILKGGDDKFKESLETFLQLKSVKKTHSDSSRSAKAYQKLQALAGQYKSIMLARIAVAAQSGGHFDKVIVSIDNMIATLRKEEADDIAHRDLCENELNGNKNEGADLQINIDKATKKLGRLGNNKDNIEEEIDKVKKDIKATEDDMQELLDFRNDEVAAFRKALKVDTESVGLLNDAIHALSKFYKNNKIEGVVDLHRKAPEYTEDPDKAPSTWEGSYGGRKSESTGILAILSMLVEDLEKEMADAKSDDADAQEKYLKQNGALTETLNAQKATKVTLEEELAGVDAKIDVTEDYKESLEGDLKGSNAEKKALNTDCDWVKTHFDSRRSKRKTEMDGLQEAKDFLAGSGYDSPVF